MRKPSITLLTGAMGLATTVSVHAAPITWGPATAVSTGVGNSSDVSTNGALVEAYNCVANDQIAAATPITVNGVTFTPTTSLLGADPKNGGTNDFSADTNSGDPDYDSILSTLEYGGGTNLVTLTVGDGDGNGATTGAGLLTVGDDYEIQVWYVDTRGAYDARQTPVGDGNGNTVTLNDQFAIGTFTADRTTQVITLESPGFGQAHINAYQVRALNVPPSVTLSTASDPVNAAYTVDVTFSKDVTGLEDSDFVVSNGTASGVSPAAGPASVYTVTITPTAPGAVTVDLPADRVTSPNTASNSLVTTYAAPGMDVPTVSLSTSASEPVSGPYTVDVVFSEDVTGLKGGDFAVSGGSASGVLPASGPASVYTVTITPSVAGDLSVTLPAGTVLDNDGDNLPNDASNTLLTAYALSGYTSGLLDLSGRDTSGLGTGESNGYFSSPKTFGPATDFSLDDIAWSSGTQSGTFDLSFIATSTMVGIKRGGLGAWGTADSSAGSALVDNGESITIDTLAISDLQGDLAGQMISGLKLVAVYLGNETSGDGTSLNGVAAAGASGGSTTAGMRNDISPAESVAILGTGGNGYSINGIDLTFEIGPPATPVPTLTAASSSVSGPFTVDVTFTEPVSGLEEADFAVTNGSASDLMGSGAVYSILITAAAEGDVTVLLPAGSATDLDGDLLTNSESNSLVTTVQLPDYPTAVIYGPNTTTTPSYDVYLTFAEGVAGLSDGDFQIVNGTASGTVSTSADTHDTYANTLVARFYKTTITATSPGPVEVTLPAGAVTDTDGDSVTNPVSNTFVTNCTADFGERWIVDDAADWTANTDSTSNLTIAGGFAEPTADSAQFTSVMKTFPVKKKAANLTLTQSPVWDNWNSAGNIQPAGAGDAPVLVPVGNDNYYFLGLGGTGGYHAWHSTDMVNWTHRGPVTPPGTGRWVTSAEYKDGEFYIYSDDPNDHNPHLFKDANLDDGIVGTDMGLAFVKETSGSDCSLIRSDEDGLFHIIYEDWSPLSARTHSWDSPLAGHTSSADGLTGFTAHEHQPPVDHRTNPTGTIAYYNHPNRSNVPYEVHTPEQDAFGDWTSIKIGSRFYLFGDYDQAGGGIKVARFTSDSIYDGYEFVGSLGGGHPDPTVGFAEGQFYLITQQSTDFTSPGPWVDGVEARAGVDTDGNGSIDQWTTWQTVAEQYDHTPGFIRVVSKTPARIDLSGLPAGFGFQYEFRVDDTVVSGVSPIMDRVELSFAPSNFQAWSNEAGTPANATGDHNANSIPNLVEFALGASTLPQRQSDGSLTVTMTQEALEDGHSLDLEFSEDLENWEIATLSTVGVKLLSTNSQPNGDEKMTFELIAPNGEFVFWRLAVN